MRSWRAYSLYPHNDHGIDICFETAAPVFKVLKQSNGFISPQSITSNVYQISLGIELFICFLRVSFTCKNVGLLAYFLVCISFIFRCKKFYPYLYEFLKIPCKDASSAFDLFFQTYVGCKARILLITKKQNVSFNLVNQFKCPRRCIRLKIFCILNIQRYEIEFLTFFHAFVFYFIWSFNPM